MKKGTMKAIRVRQFGDPEVLRLEEVSKPPPGAGQVLVRMHAIGVNPVDLHSPRELMRDCQSGLTHQATTVRAWLSRSATPLRNSNRAIVFTPRDQISGAYAKFALCKTQQVPPVDLNPAAGTAATTASPPNEKTSEVFKVAGPALL